MEKGKNEKEETHKSNDLKKKPAKTPLSRNQAYGKYSGMAFQLGATIALGAFIGRKLDEYFALDKPLLTALFALLATVGGIYALIRGLMKQ